MQIENTPTFVSREPWRERRIKAMAIYCSDGRWGDAVDEFCHQGLRVPAYDRFAVPGGPGWISDSDSSRFYLCQAARHQIDFLVTAHGLERIILITHKGCAFYAQRFDLSPEARLQKQLEEVEAASKILRRWFDGMQVEGYLATTQAEAITFHAIEDAAATRPRVEVFTTAAAQGKDVHAVEQKLH